MSKFTKKFILTAALSLAMATSSLAAAVNCPTEVSSVLDKQRQSYIAGMSDIASQNYSKRPGTFASTTCLDNLMKGGGMDIFFKPPSLDNILNMVKNLACEQASQIFGSLMSGGKINGGGALAAGELIKGVNLGGNMGGISFGSSGSFGSSSAVGLKDLFK